MPHDLLFPLVLAVLAGLLEIVCILLIRSPEKELMHWAAKGDTAKIKGFLRKLPFTFYIDAKDKNGMTPLMHAAKQGHVEIVRLLLEKNADRNTRNSMGQTALDIAVAEGHIEIIQHLQRLERGNKSEGSNHQKYLL